MTTFNADKNSLNPDTATLPAARRAQAAHGRPTRLARQLVSAPASLYGWISGPPMTNLERERATLADVKNSKGAGTMLM